MVSRSVSKKDPGTRYTEYLIIVGKQGGGVHPQAVEVDGATQPSRDFSRLLSPLAPHCGLTPDRPLPVQQNRELDRPTIPSPRQSASPCALRIDSDAFHFLQQYTLGHSATVLSAASHAPTGSSRDTLRIASLLSAGASPGDKFTVTRWHP
jgi:hypothetical protein